MKTFISLLSLVALVAFTYPASAATISNTNDGSFAKIGYWLSVHINGTNNNMAEIMNEVTSTANSGGNTITSEEYQSETSIKTGDAEAISNVENNANVIETDSTTETEFGSDNGDKIDSTNDESTAKIKESENVTEDYVNHNMVAVGNLVAAVANSGDNLTTSGEEVQNASIQTGASSTGSSVTNFFNKISEKFHRSIH